MTKADLVNNVGKASGVSKKEADAAVVEMFDSMRSALTSGDKVTIVGFGTFSVKAMAAKKGRNPQTGESIDICAYNKVSFKAGKDLKESVK